MSIGIILACVPTIRPLFDPDFLDYLRSHLGRYYSKFHHTEAGYISHVDDWQRLYPTHAVGDPLHMNTFPSSPDSPPSSQAYGNFTKSQGARTLGPVDYRDEMPK